MPRFESNWKDIIATYRAYLRHSGHFNERQTVQIVASNFASIRRLHGSLRKPLKAMLNDWGRDDYIEFSGLMSYVKELVEHSKFRVNRS